MPRGRKKKGRRKVGLTRARRTLVVKSLNWFFEMSIPVPFSGCWIWMGPTNGMPNPHGKTWYNGRSDYVHRVVWMLVHKKEILKGYAIDHLCKTRLCCNPDHLECVTMATNTLRGDGIAFQYKPSIPPLSEIPAPFLDHDEILNDPAYDPFELA